MADTNFLGAGMKFPPQVDKGTGRFQVSSQELSVKESVYLILMTNRGERWLRPEFGGQLMSYTFMDTSVTMLSIMAGELKSLILEQEPRVSSLNVEIDPDPRKECLIVNLSYAIADTNRRDNLVFPFYLTADSATGEEDTLGL